MRKRAYDDPRTTVAGTVQVSTAVVAPAATLTHARSAATSKVPPLSKSMYPHTRAVLLTPDSGTLTEYVLPARPVTSGSVAKASSSAPSPLAAASA